MLGFGSTTVFQVTSFDLTFPNPWAITVQFSVEWFHKSRWWSGPSVPPKNVALMNKQQLRRVRFHRMYIQSCKTSTLHKLRVWAWITCWLRRSCFFQLLSARLRRKRSLLDVGIWYFFFQGRVHLAPPWQRWRSRAGGPPESVWVRCAGCSVSQRVVTSKWPLEECLYHRNWQMLQIRTCLPSPSPSVVKHRTVMFISNMFFFLISCYQMLLSIRVHVRQSFL